MIKNLFSLTDEQRIALRISLLYAMLGGIWILTSDELLQRLIDDPALLTSLQTAKGWVYVLLTMGFLYALVFNNLTSQKETRRKAQSTQEKFASLFHKFNDAIFITNFQGELLEVNDRACEKLGYTRQELLSMTLDEIETREYAAGYPGRLEVIKRKGTDITEVEARRKNGTVIPTEISTRLIDYQGQQALLAIARDISRRREDEKTIARYVEQLETLHNIDQVLIEEQSIEEMIEQTLSLLQDFVPFQLAGVLEYHPLPGELNPVLFLNVEVEKVQSVPSAGMAGVPVEITPERICEMGEYRVVQEVEEADVEESVVGFLRSHDLRSAILVPLRVQEDIIGMLVVGFHQDNAVDEDASRMIARTGRLLAIAIHDVQLMEENRAALVHERHLSEVARIIASSLDQEEVLKRVVSQSVELVNADAGTLALVDPQGTQVQHQHHHRLPEELRGRSITRGQGLAWDVIESREPRIIDDYQTYPRALPVWKEAGLRSVVIVPLLDGDQCIGVLAGIRVDTGVPFSKHDLDLMTTVGRQAVTAIQNARYYQDAERRLNSLLTFKTIDRSISSSLDLDVTLDIFLSEVVGKLGVDAANVYLADNHINTLSLRASRGFLYDNGKRSSLRFGEGYLGRVASEREMINVHQVQDASPPFVREELMEKEGFDCYHAYPLVAKGSLKGVLEFFHRSDHQPTDEWLSLMESLGHQAAIAIDNAELFQNLQRRNMELNLAYDTTLEGWATALELRDVETEGHSRRVTQTTLQLSKIMGMDSKELPHIRRGALLHDIGKMGVPDHVIHKPGELDEEEWEIMRQHPVYAKKLLSPIDFLKPALDIPYSHHERWDGSGYPEGLSGEGIPLEARIFAVVDVWDALRSDRPYRGAWSDERARNYIKEQSGKQFDPRVVDGFLEMI